MSVLTATRREPAGLIVSAGALSVAGVLSTIVAPLLVDALTDAGLGTTRIGSYLTVLHMVQVVVILSLAGTGLVARIDRRVVGALGCTVSAAALMLAAWSTDAHVLLGLMGCVGLGAGLAYASGGSALSFAHDTERAYSIVTIASIVVGAIVLGGTALIPADLSRQGIFCGLAAVLVLLGVAGWRMPPLQSDPRPAAEGRRIETARPTTSDGSAAQREVPQRSAPWLSAPGVALIAGYFMLNVGLLAVWTFSGSIASTAGLSSATSWLFLGASQVLSVVGCVIAWRMGSAPGKLSVLVASLLALVVGKVLVGSALLVPYVVGILITNLTFYTVIPFVFAAGADLNPRSGRLVVVVGAAAMAAGAVAPLAGGYLAGDDQEWMRLGLGAGLVVLLSIPLLLFAVRSASRVTAASAQPASAGAGFEL